jgi:Spy/CpxP family protein refolding chaperone
MTHEFKGDRDMRGGEGSGMGHGMWWKDSALAQKIGLSADQQKRIDDLFLQNRIQLIHLHATLEEEQVKLDPLLTANPVDQARAGTQIDRIADTRASLEKVNAKMLLSIRGVLTADQWTKLQDERHSHFRGMREEGPRGPGARTLRGPRGSMPPAAPAQSIPPAAPTN